MGLIRLFRRLMYAQVLVGIFASCAAEQNPGLLLIAGSLWALSWYVVESPTGRAVPRALTLVAALAATAVFAGEFSRRQSQDLVPAIAHFTMWLQVILLYGAKENREYAQLLALSLLQMISASVMTMSMLFGILLVVYCVLALFNVLLLQLKITADRVHEANMLAAPPGERVPRPRAVAGRGHRLHFRLTALGTGGLCALIATLAFLLLPRMDHHRLPLAIGSVWTQQATSFHPEVSLRHPPGGRVSREAVLNMSLTHSKRPIAHASESWLLRGAAMDQYNARIQAWTSSLVGIAGREQQVKLSSKGRSLMRLPRESGVLEAHITLLNPNRQHLFTLHPVAHVASLSLGAVHFNPYDQHLKTVGISVGPVVYKMLAPDHLPPGLDLGVAYGATPNTPWRMRLAFGARPVHDQDYARGWTVEAARVSQLARDIIAGAGLHRDAHVRHDPADLRIARHLTSFLSDPTRFEYTLDVSPTELEDPIIGFLFTHRRGHCEFFASGLVAMARSLGLGARVVTGYRASEYNDVGGYYIVRHSNAHAWAEVETGPGNWRTFDPSPQAAVAETQSAGQGLLHQVRQLYETLEFAWARSVVAYNRNAREQVLGKARQSVEQATTGRGSRLARLGRWCRGIYDRLRLDRPTQMFAAGILCFIVIGLASLLRTVIVRRSRLAALQLTSLPRPRRRLLVSQLRFYLTMLDMLERRGHVRPAWQSPFGFAQQLAARDPTRFDPVVVLTELFYEIRFGYRPLDEHRRTRIRSSLRRLERALARRPRPGPDGPEAARPPRAPDPAPR